SVRKRYFPDEDPIGHRISIGESDGKPVWCEIVGVVGDVHRWSLSRPVRNEGYIPLAQNPVSRMTVLARSSHAEALLQDLPGIVASVDPEQAIADPCLMKERVAMTVGPERFKTQLLTTFAGIGLLLAVLG